MSRSEHNWNDSFEFGARSHVSSSHRASILDHSPLILSGLEVHQETADLANIGVEEGLIEEEPSVESYEPESSPIPIDTGSSGKRRQYDKHQYGKHQYDKQYSDTSSLVPLADKNKTFYASTSRQDKHSDTPDLEAAIGPISNVPPEGSQHMQIGASDKVIPQPKAFAVRAASYLPAVFLGTLLNVLDALSYGMIMFPIGEAVFSQMAPSGLSMFYISTIISQLVYSSGFSAFRSGIGSEMIEVTPFFHSMALGIAGSMSGKSDEAILATVIVTYAISSVVTGIIFFLLGKLRLGALVGFFPRHILVGCIGGVGYFLVVTGIEVSSRLEGGLFYNLATFEFLFRNSVTVLQWTVPLVLTIILILLHQKIHHSLLVPMFFIGVFVAFHVIVAVVRPWDLDLARKYGWVFPAVQNNAPWYAHYKLYRFNLVDWWAIAKQFPTMLALTFFGILHVPINVPALAVSVGMDQFDVDRELVAHGYSNAISGLVGSIQNYLVYTNSVLFIRAGADDRLAGIMLAAATAAVLVTGPVVIGYIPVCVVGSLIYLLGYELLKEAIYDTWGKLRKIEYSTIIIIVVVMGAWDFVYGVLVGILLACLSFVVQAARRPVVQGTYTGVVARSTVLRHPKQQEFLKDVGSQICVIKLQGSIFFGSIGGLEDSIRDIFEKTRFQKNPIKFLILDMKSVFSIDFSAAEGFRRILNLTNEFATQLIIASVEEDDDTVNALRDAGLWDTNCDLDIQLFNDLNFALEWCENSFLKTYNKLQVKNTASKHIAKESLSKLGSASKRSSLISDPAFGTPRTAQVFHAATNKVRDEQRMQNKFYSNNDNSLKQTPLPLLMITFSGLSNKDESFWTKLAPFLIKERIPKGMMFYDTEAHEPNFFILESGLVRSVLKFESENRELPSSILPKTAFGDLLKVNEYRRITYTAVNETVAWKLTASKLQELLKSKDGQLVFNELLIVSARLMKERLDTLSANLVISS